MASSSAKRAKTREGSRLTFLPRWWWEFLDWLKEARFIVKQVTGGRCSSRAWALLNSTEQYINDHFGWREFSLNAEIVPLWKLPQASFMPAYDSVRGQLVRLQAELLNVLERMVVAQRCTNFWAPCCIYFHDCLASRTLSGCVVAFILFCDEVEGCIGVYTDWQESKAEIFQQVQYGELATFRELAEWVTQFAEDGIN
jgi:hypothetical protein